MERGIGWDDRGAWQRLFNALAWYEGDQWLDDVILPAIEGERAAVAELHQIGHPDSARVPLRDSPHVLWGLYALGRVLDVLASPMQPVNDDPALLSWMRIPRGPWWYGRLPTPEALTGFLDAIGASRIAEPAFHPFFHEIVDVEPAADPAEPPVLVREEWPGALVGSMLLLRSGVTVRAGAQHLVPGVASRSCLYWAWWRRNRMASDLSHGWGHNSQWRTEFRRDYVLADELLYNIDGDGRPPDEVELTEAQRETLLRYRCSTTVDLGLGAWIWEDRLAEPR
ncbi:MAG: hypothetical protein M3488_08820 [Actinomycetota bacterium]|nr:hypothetical protein [Actinomycetota bacterium]